MSKVCTDHWQEYKVGELFDIHPTKAYKLTNAQLLDEGDTPVVVNSAYNNGIGGYSSLPPTETGNKVTFSDTVDANTIFYQDKDFIGYPHVQGLYPIGEHAHEWNSKRLQFFVSIFRKTAIAKGFDYGNKFRRDIATELIIKLPVISKNHPNWEYMDSYMQSINKRAINHIQKIESIIGGSKSEIDTSNWRRFHLYDTSLFTIDSGNKLDRIKMTNNEPSVNFVGRANANNGVTDYIDRIDEITPYEAGCMTVSLGGEYLGSCFIQDKPFYTSQNVNVLIPKHPMSDYSKHFIATMIFREGRLHYKAFQDELNRHMKTDFTIPLPQTANGTPDWNYMEQYMRTIERKAQSAIHSLLTKLKRR